MKRFVFSFVFFACLMLCLCSCHETPADVPHVHAYTNKSTADEYLLSKATCRAPAVYYYSCACGERGEECFTDDTLGAHVYDQKTVAPEYLSAKATCSSPALYYYSCECKEKGTQTFAVGEALAHVFDRKNTDAAYCKTPATCRTASEYYYSCACGAVGEEVFTGWKSAHVYDRRVADAAYLMSEASCQRAALYYYSCACGAHGGAVFEYGEKLPSHRYTVSVTEQTCASDGYTLYSCPCGHSYRENVKPMTYDHDFQMGRAQGDGYTYETYICTVCGVQAFEYGNADGSYFRETNCRYYLIGKFGEGTYELVIHGTGDMPDYTETRGRIDDRIPPWRSYLVRVDKITVAEGITSVGAYAFYDKELETPYADFVEYSIADSVRVVKPYGLSMKTRSIVFGASLMRIERDGIRRVTGAVYLPRSVSYVGNFLTSCTYFYEGTAQEFGRIRCDLIREGRHVEVPVKTYLAETMQSVAVYVDAAYLHDMHRPLKKEEL